MSLIIIITAIPIAQYLITEYMITTLFAIINVINIITTTSGCWVVSAAAAPSGQGSYYKVSESERLGNKSATAT